MTWETEVDTFVRRFAERTERWSETPGDLEDSPSARWTDPDHPDERLDAAYRSGIVQRDGRGVAADDGWDSITVLRARGRRLAKRIHPNGAIDAYDSPRHFDMAEIPVNGVDHLEEDLRRLLGQQDRCIVRGQIADLGRAKGLRRLLHPDGEEPASLVEVPRRWLAIDIDSLTRPANVAATDVAGCAGIAIATLPTAFHERRCVAQATASHGVKPGIRLRLWYWLDRPVRGCELKRWLRPCPVDQALFGAAQIIYTAAPVFQGGRDPLPNRMIRLPGAARVEVPELPEPKRRPVVPIKPTTGLSPYAEAALDSACRRILGASAGQQEATINGECFAIGTLAGANGIPAAFAHRTLLWAATRIPNYDNRRPWHPAELERKVERAFADGLRHPREALRA